MESEQASTSVVSCRATTLEVKGGRGRRERWGGGRGGEEGEVGRRERWGGGRGGEEGEVGRRERWGGGKTEADSSMDD